MNIPRRRTDAELTAAAESLKPDPQKLPPLPLWETLDLMADTARDFGPEGYLLDMLDAIDHDLPADDPHHAAAVAAVGELADALTVVRDVTRRMAELIDHETRPDRLKHDPTLKHPTPAQCADPRFWTRFTRR